MFKKLIAWIRNFFERDEEEDDINSYDEQFFHLDYYDRN